MNNYSEEEVAICINRLPETFKIFIAKKEIGECGTPHLQCYGETKHPQTMKGLQKKLKEISIPRFHVEVAKGSLVDNVKYITKTGYGFDIQIGDIPPRGIRQLKGSQSKADQLNPVIEMVKTGTNIHGIANEYPSIFIRNSTGIEKLIHHFTKPRDHQTIGYWLWGETGQGKSRWARTNFPEAYYKDPETDWWDGYYGQETVIIDDYRPSKSLSFAKILRLVDRYPLQVQVKCAFAQFVSKRIIFTSPMSLLDTFSRCEWLKSEELDQLQRRIPHQLRFFPGSLSPQIIPATLEMLPVETTSGIV